VSVLEKVKEERSVLNTAWQWKHRWLGNVFRSLTVGKYWSKNEGQSIPYKKRLMLYMFRKFNISWKLYNVYNFHSNSLIFLVAAVLKTSHFWLNIMHKVKA